MSILKNLVVRRRNSLRSEKAYLVAVAVIATALAQLAL